MNVNSVNLIGKSKTLNNHICVNSIIDIIVNDIKNIPQYQSLNKSIDLVLHICLLIENLVNDNNIKGEPNFKLDMAVKIYEKLGNVKPDDKEFLINSIKFLHSNGKIKKVKKVIKVFNFVKNYFVKNKNE